MQLNMNTNTNANSNTNTKVRSYPSLRDKSDQLLVVFSEVFMLQKHVLGPKQGDLSPLVKYSAQGEYLLNT